MFFKWTHFIYFNDYRAADQLPPVPAAGAVDGVNLAGRPDSRRT